MSETSGLVAEHLPKHAGLIESYIIETETLFPADMASAGHWEHTMAFDKGAQDSALYGACRGDSIEMVKELLKRPGIDVNFGLLGASSGGNIEAADLMVAHGATLDENHGGNLAEAAAKFGNSLPMVKWLAERRAETPRDIDYILEGSCGNGNADLISYAIDRGARNWDQGAFAAAEGGNMETVALMLGKGASINSVLAGACAGGSAEIANHALQRNATDYNAAARAAAGEGRLDYVELMFKQGATDVNGVFTEGYHRDDWSAARLKVVEWALARGAERCLLCEKKSPSAHIDEMRAALAK